MPGWLWNILGGAASLAQLLFAEHPVLTFIAFGVLVLIGVLFVPRRPRETIRNDSSDHDDSVTVQVREPSRPDVALVTPRPTFWAAPPDTVLHRNYVVQTLQSRPEPKAHFYEAATKNLPNSRYTDIPDDLQTEIRDAIITWAANTYDDVHEGWPGTIPREKLSILYLAAWQNVAAGNVVLSSSKGGQEMIVRLAERIVADQRRAAIGMV